jgi:uncharacterized protein (TIGR02466 family)
MDKEYFLFPNKVIEHQCEDFGEIQNGLIDLCYHIKETCDEHDYTVVHGWQSSVGQYTNPSFEPFLPFIFKHIGICFKLYGFDENYYDFELNALVVNINNPGSYQLSHIHPNSHMSGAIWLKAPVDCGNFVFQSTDCFAKSTIYDCVKRNVAEEEHLKPFHHFIPKEGKMIFFPPDLRHHVQTNLSNQDRISLGFNILINQK